MPDDAYKPPAGPPPGKEQIPSDAPPAYSHPWQAIPEANPDHSELPPPPSFQYDYSTVNASPNDAERAHDWTAANALWPARQLSDFDRQCLSVGYSGLIKPRELAGSMRQVKDRAGVWYVSSSAQCGDCCLLGSQPLYSPWQQQALAYASSSATAAAKAKEAGFGDSSRPRLAYFEIKILRTGRDSGIGIGFIAPPYPTWRLPGWERASIGVHGDDGHRFVNDTWGGRSFTDPFVEGETIGIGMEIASASEAPPSYSQFNSPSGPSEKSRPPNDVKVFLTRNGKRVDGWDLHEPVDADIKQPGGVHGLEGMHDLHPAVGVYGPADFEVIFSRHNWKYRPEA